MWPHCQSLPFPLLCMYVCLTALVSCTVHTVGVGEVRHYYSTKVWVWNNYTRKHLRAQIFELKFWRGYFLWRDRLRWNDSLCLSGVFVWSAFLCFSDPDSAARWGKVGIEREGVGEERGTSTHTYTYCRVYVGEQSTTPFFTPIATVAVVSALGGKRRGAICGIITSTLLYYYHTRGRRGRTDDHERKSHKNLCWRNGKY